MRFSLVLTLASFPSRVRGDIRRNEVSTTPSWPDDHPRHVDPKKGTLTIQLDREPEPTLLPAWYLDDGHIDYGYALTGHKAQGITVDRTYAVIGGDNSREWAYVAMSRGRESNRAYLLFLDTDEHAPTYPIRVEAIRSK